MTHKAPHSFRKENNKSRAKKEIETEKKKTLFNSLAGACVTSNSGKQMSNSPKKDETDCNFQLPFSTMGDYVIV